MPVTGIKLLRDQLAQVIGENKRQGAKLKENETKNAELALAVDRIILEISLIKQERDEALARVERLENALRESDRHIRAAKKRTDVSETDCRDAEARHARLQLVYHQAKETASATPAQCETFVQRTVQIALTYPEKLSNKIVSAAPFLFTFLLHPGMEPTNNHTEREVRPIVLRRKVSGQIGSVDGMRRFGVLFTCLLTWRKRKLDIYRELDRILLPAV